MKQVTVERNELLAVVKANLEKHLADYNKAMLGYREAAIYSLERILADAKDGKPIRRSILLPEPSSSEKSYNLVISMLSMSVDEKITLTETEYDQYVLDNWYWKEEFLLKSSSYIK